MNKQLTVILSGVALLVVFLFAAKSYDQERAEEVQEMAQEQSPTLVPDHAMTYGAEDGRVVLVEFFDPACETCRVFHHPVKELVDAHPGKIKLVFRYAPFHHGSEDVVKLLEAARLQGQYFEALEMMFETQPRWASHHDPRPDLLWTFLPQLGLDMEQLAKDVQSPEIEALVQQDLADLQILHVRKTPSYFVNGTPLETFGYDPLVALVESELAVQYPE